MAELHIERKERSAWPWLLLGALLIALVLWFVFGMADDDADVAVADGAVAGAVADPATPAASADPAATEMPAAVTTFVQFAQTTATGDAGVAHDYTSNGLRQLADALGAVTERATVSGVVNVSERVDEIRDRANQMQQNATSTQHALQTREASLLAAALMREIAGTQGDAATSARDAYTTAEQLQPETPLLDQMETVRRFFDQSATALRGLAMAP